MKPNTASSANGSQSPSLYMKTDLSTSAPLTSAHAEAINRILARQLDVQWHQLTPDASFNHDLGADSLDAVQITMELEDELNLVLPDDAWDAVQTVGDLHAVLAALLEARS